MCNNVHLASLSLASVKLHLSGTIPPATTLLGLSAGMSVATTLSPEQLHQIAAAVANILRYPPSENSLVTSTLLATVTEGSECTVHPCTLVTVILLIIHICIGVYR